MDFIQGTIKNITFYNEENNFAILKIVQTKTNINQGLFDDAQKVVAVKGYIVNPKKGEEMKFYGGYETHPKFGNQFNAESYEKISETSKLGVIEYLSSDLFKGVGEKTAERIVNTLGKEAIAKILEDKTCLDEVDKLSAPLKETLYEGLIEHQASEQTFVKLYDYGISPKIASKIFKMYEQSALKVIEQNPYKLIDDIEGIGFERADIIAKNMGFNDDHPLRIKAMIIYLFKYISNQLGHTHMLVEKFINIALDKLNKDQDLISEGMLEKALNDLIKENRFIIENDFLTLKALSKADDEIVNKIKTLHERTIHADKDKIIALIHDFETLEKIQYTDTQKAAIVGALSNPFMVLTGGPGTGKTTVIKGIIYVYCEYHSIKKPTANQSDDVFLVAPTGRAAKRIKETANAFATTIHRLLGYTFDGTFHHDKYTPVDGKLFIVDEASMIDTYLASQLLQSLPDTATVIMVGDDEQIPSVGPGQVLKDLIATRDIFSVSLDTVHRQSKGSSIIELANAMRNGYLPSSLNQQQEDRFVIKLMPNMFKERLKKMVDYLLDKGYDLHEDIQILIPMYKGAVGIDEINRFMQETYNKNTVKSLEYGDKIYRINDKVLQLTNQAEDGVMNGDQGRVIAIDEDKNQLIVEFYETQVTYHKKDLNHLTHAYAMSIHKSQGSEYKVVIVPIFKNYMIMLKRKLIYTAITRASEMLILAGQMDGLSYAIERVEDDRITLLKDKLNHQTISRKKQMDAIIEAFSEDEESTNEATHYIHDENIPFDTLGEDLDGLTPYDFLDNTNKG